MSLDDAFPTREAKENYIKDIILTLTNEGESGNSILQTLVDLGLGINRNRFFELRREALEIQKYSEQISVLTSNRQIPRSYFIEVPNRPFKRNFTYQATVRYFDKDLQDYQIKEWQLGSNEELTINEIDQEIREAASESPIRIESVTVHGAYVNPGVF